MGKKIDRLDFKFELEKDLQKYVMAMLGSYKDIYVVKISDRFKKGIPDLILSVRGYFIAIELKTYKGVISDLQEIEMGIIKANKGATFVARTLREVREGINNVMREKGENIIFKEDPQNDNE